MPSTSTHFRPNRATQKARMAMKNSSENWFSVVSATGAG